MEMYWQYAKIPKLVVGKIFTSNEDVNNHLNHATTRNMSKVIGKEDDRWVLLSFNIKYDQVTWSELTIKRI